jgi:hypothetical protein
MVLPLIAAGIGAGGSIISGMMGANAASEAQDTNWKINLLNYYARERERQDRIRQAGITDRENKLGVTDARGNQTKFVPGVGWVSTLSKEDEAMQDAQNAEQMRVLEQDLPARRAVMQRNVQRGLEDESSADSLRREMRTLRPGNDQELESLLYGAATRSMGESFDATTEAATREAARTGSSNIGKLLSGIAEQRAKSFGDAAMEAKLRARGSGQQEYDARRSGLSNLYNMFATRASVAPDVSYAPQNVDAGSQRSQALLSKQGLEAGSNLATAFGAKGGSMDYMQPDYGMANAVGSGARALAGMFRQPGLGFGDSGGSGGTSSYSKYQDRLNF